MIKRLMLLALVLVLWSTVWSMNFYSQTAHFDRTYEDSGEYRDTSETYWTHHDLTHPAKLMQRIIWVHDHDTLFAKDTTYIKTYYGTTRYGPWLLHDSTKIVSASGNDTSVALTLITLNTGTPLSAVYWKTLVINAVDITDSTGITLNNYEKTVDIVWNPTY